MEQANPLMHVLLIEDDRSEVFLLRRSLAEAAYPRFELTHVERLGEALELLGRQSFDAVLSDLSLPDSQGLDILERLCDAVPELPVLALTGLDEPAQIARALEIGAQDYLIKGQVDGARLVRALVGAIERKRAERPLRLLAEAGERVGASLDPAETAHSVARLVVPRLADWCTVERASAEGTLHLLEAAHVEPGLRDVLREMLSRFRVPASASVGPQTVARSGKTEMFPDFPPSVLAAYAVDEEHLELLQAINFQSSVSLPLCARGRVLGVLTLGMKAQGRRPSSENIDTAEELGRRAAVALDNALAYRRLAAAGARKDEFLVMLDDQFRNPLGPLKSALDLIRLRSADDPELRWASLLLDRQMQHLGQLTEDLLEMARLTSGRVELRRRAVELGGLVERALETTRPLVESRGQKLLVALSNEPVSLEADPGRIEQIIAQLVAFASRRTPTGGRISVSSEREENEVVLRIRDSGAEIASELIERLFEPMIAVERAAAGAQDESGISLPVARALVEMHEGSIEARSDGPGRGMEIVLRLPALQLPHLEEAEGANETPAGTALSLLVVDDNVDSATGMAEVLEMWGHQPGMAFNGPEALAKAAEMRPDVVLLDIGLPGMDGYEIAQKLRQQPGLEHVVLVALTGYRSDEDVQRGREAGFDQYFTKPVDLNQLSQYLSTRQPRH
jgi:CheY-like chemotaxis protein